MFTTLLSGDFYPRPPRGGRPPSGRNTPDTPNFYPRPPRGGRLTARGSITPGINFYPRPPRGGRPAGHCGPRRTIIISIHALREEGDHVQSFAGEGIEGFLSTPSARRATGIGYVIQRPSIISIHALREEGDLWSFLRCPLWLNFYPRPPRGGRHRHTSRRLVHEVISIHALREEGDCSQGV